MPTMNTTFAMLIVCLYSFPVHLLAFLEEKYLLIVGYKFIIPDVDVTVNRPPSKCIAIDWVALSYEPILNKYNFAPAQIVPTNWHNICFYIAKCELCGLTCSGHAFGLIHTV